MYKKLEYTIDENIIAELLGTQNFTNKESAILELVKNSFDAQADILKICFEKNKIIIEDDGIGMNVEDIEKYWMHIGKSIKDYVVYDKKNQERILSGSKGIGRFALSRLGKKVSIYSRKENDNLILWKTDWNKNSLEEFEDNKEIKIGTKIIIENLRDNWDKVNIKKLLNYLSRTYKNNLMKIFIHYDNEILEVKNYFLEATLGVNFLTKINLNYNSQNQMLYCNILSDEFKEEAQIYCKNENIKNYTKSINILEELKNNKDLNLNKDILKEKLEILGNFSAELYFILKSKKQDIERFLYKVQDSSNFFESGVILYRNSFSLSSYNGVRDWVGFSKRARKSPATAIHPTGSWRVRDNNIAGKVEIDKKENAMLKDLSNRQGLEENEYYDIFLLILDKGLGIFEKYRQNIIRKINEKNKVIEVQENNLINEIIKYPEKLKNLTNQEIKVVAENIADLKNRNSQLVLEIKDIEVKYTYDFRILNTLSTSGLKATSIAHDLENDNNFIATNSDNLVKALKKCNVWDIVNSSENTKIQNRNVPLLINKNKEINKKLSRFMSSILEETKKSKFTPKEINIFEFLTVIKDNWERDYSRLNINLEIDKDIFLYTGEDLLKVIFDNLLLNSFQQNKDMKKIAININIFKENSKLKINYQDYGKGLDKKYKDDPFKIIEVHETNRVDGHGLGMWIINNTIKFGHGEILEIKNNEKGGFQIVFTFGER